MGQFNLFSGYDLNTFLPPDILEYKPGFFGADESKKIMKVLLETTPV